MITQPNRTKSCICLDGWWRFDLPTLLPFFNANNNHQVLLNVFAMELESALKKSAEERKSAALTARMQGAGASKAAESASALMARAVTATREDVFAACESAMAKLTGG